MSGGRKIVIYGSQLSKWDALEQRMASAKEAVDKALASGDIYPRSAAAMGGVLFGDINLTATTEPTYSTDLTSADWHMAVAGGHCGKADCTKCDPMERYVDGLTVRECLERYTAWQREDVRNTRWMAETRKPAHQRAEYLTIDQFIAARSAWSAALKAKMAEANEKELRRIVVDDDRWEP